jgi:hypothetical protein
MRRLSFDHDDGTSARSFIVGGYPKGLGGYKTRSVYSTYCTDGQLDETMLDHAGEWTVRRRVGGLALYFA